MISDKQDLMHRCKDFQRLRIAFQRLLGKIPRLILQTGEKNKLGFAEFTSFLFL